MKKWYVKDILSHLIMLLNKNKDSFAYLIYMINFILYSVNIKLYSQSIFLSTFRIQFLDIFAFQFYSLSVNIGIYKKFINFFSFFLLHLPKLSICYICMYFR